MSHVAEVNKRIVERLLSPSKLLNTFLHAMQPLKRMCTIDLISGYACETRQNICTN